MYYDLVIVMGVRPTSFSFVSCYLNNQYNSTSYNSHFLLKGLEKFSLPTGSVMARVPRDNEIWVWELPTVVLL